MEIIQTSSSLQDLLQQRPKPVGFVPTMGALHRGHLSLIAASKGRDEITVCSIFVNPTQFNNPDDLTRYPRTMDKDKELLEKSGCDILFIPSVKEMYPNNDFTLLNEDFGGLDKRMEGKSRPGHFAGMITIVSKLFSLVNPANAYFGRKDYQQLLLVKRFVKNHNLPIEIIGCPIVREKDGLAMSSRNALLTKEERKAASVIPKALIKLKEAWGSKPIDEIKSIIINELIREKLIRLDYLEIVGRESLLEITEYGDAIACVAVYDGNIRLIDNIELS